MSGSDITNHEIKFMSVRTRNAVYLFNLHYTSKALDPDKTVYWPSGIVSEFTDQGAFLSTLDLYVIPPHRTHTLTLYKLHHWQTNKEYR